MKPQRQSSPSQPKWPFDLRIFAVLAALWSVCLTLSAFVPIGEMDAVDPVETIFAGLRFNGYDARLVLIVESGIFMMIAIGVFAHRRWGLLLALCMMVQVVMSHLAFVIAYLPMRSEWMTVRTVASQGPMMVLIALYLWIRACDLIFDPQPPESLPMPAQSAARQPAIARSTPADVAAVAKLNI
jgi:hypothetical protein